MEKFREELLNNLCVYGNHYYLLPAQCYGCYEFRYLCGGEGEFGICPKGEFKNDYACFVDIIRGKEVYEELQKRNINVVINRYVFALMLDLDEKEKLISYKKDFENKKEDKEYQRMAKDIDYAISLPEKDILKIREIFHFDDTIENGKKFMEEIVSSYKKKKGIE